jgi:hypothetical protein
MPGDAAGVVVDSATPVGTDARADELDAEIPDGSPELADASYPGIDASQISADAGTPIEPSSGCGCATSSRTEHLQLWWCWFAGLLFLPARRLTARGNDAGKPDANGA